MSKGTKFPESTWHTEEPLTYYGEDVDEWFKRCLDDAPGSWAVGIPIRITRSDIHDHDRWVEWFHKWFSQFASKRDEEE